MDWLEKLIDSKNPIILLLTSRLSQVATRLTMGGLTAICGYVMHAPPTDAISQHIGTVGAGAGAAVALFVDFGLHWIRTRRKEAENQKQLQKAAVTGVVPPPQ